jgi:hypothetical protein
MRCREAAASILSTVGDDTTGSTGGSFLSYGGEYQQVGMSKEIALCLANEPFSSFGEVG